MISNIYDLYVFFSRRTANWNQSVFYTHEISIDAAKPR